MTAKELREMLESVPDNATVQMAIYEDYADGEECGENGAWSDTDISSVSYDVVTNTVTLTEA